MSLGGHTRGDTRADGRVNGRQVGTATFGRTIGSVGRKLHAWAQLLLVLLYLPLQLSELGLNLMSLVGVCVEVTEQSLLALQQGSENVVDTFKLLWLSFIGVA